MKLFVTAKIGFYVDIKYFRMFLRVKSDKKLKPERCYICLKEFLSAAKLHKSIEITLFVKQIKLKP